MDGDLPGPCHQPGRVRLQPLRRLAARRARSAPAHAIRAVYFQGAREAAGIPAAVLVAGYLGFGALAAAHDIPLAVAVASTAVLWALPGQIVLVEMQSLAAPLLACVLAVMLSSARFLPMTMMLMPEMRDPRHRPWKYYVAAQLLSLSGWTMAVARFPELPRAQPRMVFRLHACPRHGERRRHGRRLSRRRPPAAALGLACGTVAYLLFKRT